MIRRLIFSAACSAALLAGCAAPADPIAIDAASVARNEAGLTVTWSTLPAGAPVDVAILGADGALMIVSDDDADGTHTLTGEQAAGRPILRLSGAGGAVLDVAERVLPLQGGRNFRDLGGYAAADGRTVRWGVLYRSGTMHGLTEPDYALLRGLGVVTICDFRANEERAREATNWQAISPELTYVTRDYDTDSSALRTALSTPDVAPETVRAAMTTLYADIPYVHADSYRLMFEQLLAGAAPLAFNCSAGKDRTGVAAALVLTALGVSRETILEDYALSDDIVNYERAFGPQMQAAAPAADAPPNPWAFIAALSPEQRAPLMASDPAYLEAALAAIEAREGSVEAYLERVLGVDAADLAALRAAYLTPAANS